MLLLFHLLHTLDRVPYAALNSRIHARVQVQPVIEAERFSKLINFAMQQAGCQQRLVSDSGMECLMISCMPEPKQLSTHELKKSDGSFF